jgi:hypothetical protein
MAALTRAQLADLRGMARIVADGSTGVVDAVERMHRTVQRLSAPFGARVDEPTRGITGFVYRRVRGTMGLVGRGADALLGSIEARLPEGEPSPRRDGFLAILNGVYGDHLDRTGNPLAIPMSLQRGSHAPTGRLLILVHGLCMSPAQWMRDGDDHGEALHRALGFTPVYARYNSGLHVAENGRRLAQALEQLVAEWPCAVEELVVLGHSLGGLVARSACVAGESRGHRWRRALSRLVFLGTPHHGAPLERGGQVIDRLLDVSPYAAPIARLTRARSAGIRDLRDGRIVARGREPVPLPEGVACYAIAASLGAGPRAVVGRVAGDGLVTVASALGRHRSAARTLRIPETHRWVAYGMGHVELLHRPEVRAQLERWLRAPAAAPNVGDAAHA